MKSKLIFLALALITSNYALAAEVVLLCKSTNGYVKAPYGEFILRVDVNGKKLQINGYSAPSKEVIFDQDYITMESKGQTLTSIIGLNRHTLGYKAYRIWTDRDKENEEWQGICAKSVSQL